MKKFIVYIIVSSIVILTAAACSPTAAPPAVNEGTTNQNQATLAPAPQDQATSAQAALDGKALFEERCSKCHGLDRIQAKKASADGWKAVVERMVGKGANLNAAEQQAVIDFWRKTTPVDKQKGNISWTLEQYSSGHGKSSEYKGLWIFGILASCTGSGNFQFGGITERT